MTDALTLSCPACRTLPSVQMLGPGASLQGASCLNCGGTLLPTSGSERLLHEELALDRAALLELAESYGGRRYACPFCKAKMRSLILRGVDVDLCFHCGALWLDQGELERLSNHRHHGLATTTTKKSMTAPIRPPGTVRLDDRHPLQRALGRFLAIMGIGVSVGVGLHLLAPAKAILAGALFVGALALLRRRIVDIFPRARRLLRSRRLLPTDARDDLAERLDDRTFVVVRPLGPRLLAFSAFVDSCGRSIAPLDSGRVATVSRRASAHAQRLGAVVVFDPRLRDDGASALPLPAFSDTPFLVLLRPGPSAFWVFEAVGTQRECVFTMQNAVPARGNESPAERLALCFCIEVPGRNGTSTAKMRLHDDGRGCTVIVGEGGEPLGAIHRREAPRRAGTEWLTLALATRATRVHLFLPPLGLQLPFFDDAGARYGHVSLHHGSLEVYVNANAPPDVRFACCLLAAHTALDAGRLLEISVPPSRAH